MTLSRDTLVPLLRELAPELLGATLQEIRAPDVETLCLALRSPGATRWLMLRATPRLGRLHLIDRPPPNPQEAAPFQGLLRKELRGRLVGLDRLESERVVRLRFALGDAAERRLILELYGGGGNIVLLDEEDRILGRARAPRRPGCAGGHRERWAGPGRADRWTGVEHDSADQGSAPGTDGGGNSAFAVGAGVAERYAELEVEFERAARVERAIGAATRRVRDLERQVGVREAELAALGDPKRLRADADLLRGHFYLLQRGVRSVVVTDWAADGAPSVSLDLDPSLAPADLVDRAYVRARRAERGRSEGGRRLSLLRDSLVEARALLVEAERAEGEPSLPPDLGPQRQEPKPRRAPGPNRTGVRSPYVAFLAPGGIELRAGRGGADNDQLTFKHSRGNDVWLHVRGRPGAHIVIRSPGPSPSPELLLLAAQLAMARSGLEDGARAEVSWTRVKHVTKKKGMKPGAVLITQEKVLYLEHSRAAVAALVQIEGAPSAR